MGSNLPTQRQLQYERERQRGQVMQIAGYSAIVVLTIFLIMLFGGPRFDPILRIFGLHSISNEESGLYSKCSNGDTKNKFCGGREDKTDTAWKSIGRESGGKALPFSLSE